jgi:hypothetical protein
MDICAAAAKEGTGPEMETFPFDEEQLDGIVPFLLSFWSAWWSLRLPANGFDAQECRPRLCSLRA